MSRLLVFGLLLVVAVTTFVSSAAVDDSQAAASLPAAVRLNERLSSTVRLRWVGASADSSGSAASASAEDRYWNWKVRISFEDSSLFLIKTKI